MNHQSSSLAGVTSSMPALGSLLAVKGTPTRTPKFFEGTTKLNKGGTKDAWNDLGGDKLAVFNEDGSAQVLRITEYESKQSGTAIQLIERLTRKADGYGVIDWRLVIGLVKRRRAANNAFDQSWQPAILNKIVEIVVNGVPVVQASKELSAELNISVSAARPNLWVAAKWAKGEVSPFIPHRSMVRPIFDLLCSLGKQDEVLSSLRGYMEKVPKPSSFVLDVLKDFEG